MTRKMFTTVQQSMFWSFPQSLCESFFDCKVVISNSRKKSMVLQTCFLTPLCKSQSFPIESQQMIISFVSCLILRSSPMAILFGIVPRIIYAVDRNFRKWILLFCLLIGRVHISLEFMKIFPKAFNPASSIVRKIFRFAPLTTFFNVVKSIIKFCMRESMSCVVYNRRTSRFPNLTQTATTAYCSSMKNVVRWKNFDL